MKKARYTQEPPPLLLQRQGEYVNITVTANATLLNDDPPQWEADTHEFWEKEALLDLAAVEANPAAYLCYVPHRTREAARAQAQLMLDKLRAGCPVVPVPGYREGAAVCNRASDQVKLVAGLAMGGLPYYELASGEVVNLGTADIKAIAADVAAAETLWQQAKQACWAAIETAADEAAIATALADFAAVLSQYAGAQLTNAMNTKNNTSWLAGLLTGWGIKESWAKIIAGSIAGALAAAGFLSSCSDNSHLLATLPPPPVALVQAVH